MRKRFLSVMTDAVAIPEAYLPRRPTPWPTHFDGNLRCLAAWYLAEARRYACILAHRILRRWGRQEMSPEVRVRQIALPTSGEILERIRGEMTARIRQAGIDCGEMAVIVGLDVPLEIANALQGSSELLSVGSLEWVTGGGRRRLIFGMPVILSPWLEPDEFVILPLRDLRAAVSQSSREVRQAPLIGSGGYRGL